MSNISSSSEYSLKIDEMAGVFVLHDLGGSHVECFDSSNVYVIVYILSIP